jgi:hypothetical protein
MATNKTIRRSGAVKIIRYHDRTAHSQLPLQFRDTSAHVPRCLQDDYERLESKGATASIDWQDAGGARDVMFQRRMAEYRNHTEWKAEIAARRWGK